jgi:ribosomal-protein-alanine N-acetyltransferase
MGVNYDRSRAYFMTTERLGWGHWSMNDLSLARQLWENTQVTSLIGGPFTEDQVEQRLKREIASMDAYQVQYWPVFLLETDQHAGCAGLRPYRLDQHIYELGFHLRPEYWGRGLAQEAGRAVIAFAFESFRPRPSSQDTIRPIRGRDGCSPSSDSTSRMTSFILRRA